MTARRLALLVAVALCAMVVPAFAGPGMPARITPKRVGDIKLGMTIKAARKTGLVGKPVPGCELDPGSRAARLLSPLKGAVELTKSKPRRVKSIIVSRHATARGLVIGDSKADIVDAYPKAKFDDSVSETFGIILVRIPKDGGGKLQMALDGKTKKLIEFGVPYIAFCE